MSLLVIGISHRTAPVAVLERVAIPDEAATRKVLDELLTGEHVSEALVVSTCNRVEIYAVVATFHGGLTEVSGVLARHAHAEVSDLTDHLYVHYAGSAVEHLFSVAAGLDSMVVGEAQILGQLRASYALARDLHTAGRVLHEVAQQALHVGKRTHAETGIDAAGASVVTEALVDAGLALGGLGGRRALVVGAGAMGALAATHLRRAGVATIVVANRSLARAERLAASLRTADVDTTAVGLEALATEISAADVAVVCTGAVGTVLDAPTVAARAGHPAATPATAAPVTPGAPDASPPFVVCDLGLPRDVDPAVAGLPGVVVIDLETLADRLRDAAAGRAVESTRALVAEEVRAYLAAQRSAEVTPTVTALRRRAAEVVDAELLRLDGRLPDLEPSTRSEVAQTVRRVVDKLLHTPTVQVKRLAQGPGGDTYAEALRELFELDPLAPVAMSVEGGAVDSALAVDVPGPDLGEPDLTEPDLAGPALSAGPELPASAVSGTGWAAR